MREGVRPWRRHELLHVAAEDWAAVLLSLPGVAAVPLVARWADCGWPVIVRRQMDGDRPGTVPVGVPLPPILGKRRVALTVPCYAVVGRAPPPPLRAARDVAVPEWRGAIDALVALGAAHGVVPEVFGSLLWQHRTGLPYVAPGSDLDVLWSVAADCDIVALLAGIAATERQAPMRIDGEIVFPDGGAANWRELRGALCQGGLATVLVKSVDAVRLREVAPLVGCRLAA